MLNIELLLNVFTFCTQQPDRHDQRWYYAIWPDGRKTFCVGGASLLLGLEHDLFTWVPTKISQKGQPIHTAYGYIRYNSDNRQLTVEQAAEALLGLTPTDAKRLFYAEDLRQAARVTRDLLLYSPSVGQHSPAMVEQSISRLEALAGL